MQPPDIQIRQATTESDIHSVRALFERYRKKLHVDLSHVNFEAELQSLPGEYAPPTGAIFLAEVDHVIVGCCAVRQLIGTDHSNACEIKRLYVRKAFRGFGLGRHLSEAAIEFAELCGYSCVLLDTFSDMTKARTLYESMGFNEIDPYYYSPYPGTYYKKDLY